MYKLSTLFPLKRAFITGAASGLGRALCHELAADGWLLGISDINDEQLAVTHREITERGGKPCSFHLDVSNKNEFQQVAEKFLKEAGGIDLLINNAGVGDGGVFEEYSLDNWEWMVGINQMSVVYGCHLFIPIFKKQQSGHIINIASLAAISCAPQMGAYNMTKAAVVAISETLYGELMDHNIDVSCVQPSYFKTNIASGVRGGANVKKITQYLLDRSGIEPPAIAQEVLDRAGNKELYIILPGNARKLWWFKRFFPMKFRKMVKEKYLTAITKIQQRS
ncbi:MAG TPA: SDR family NAD(P)-dependent oxidoreductase [Cyclobacteriaceae bacterium]